ncbi:hypothetical protein FIC_00050 [Flavobacteriaceae bacterium 3519-10]|nr:hypothetical protein FIC_00050 [Flavobacteriaceae bacterium 3519-10]
MKKAVVITLIFISQIIFSQATRFIYQVTMKPDSTNRTDIKTETAYLDATPLKSVFYSENRLKRDSLMQRVRQTGNFDRTQMANLRSNMDFTVEKDFNSGSKVFSSRIGRDQYSYNEDRATDWQILPETTTIGDYKAQKAQTQFAGRTWFAWFTTDIPLQDGPYKFSGLPGLIIKVEDSKGDYSFDLKESKKIATIPTLEQRGSVIAVNRAAYNKQLEKFKKDPTSFRPSGGRTGGEMRSQASAAQRKENEARLNEEAKKNNNPIELD